MNILDADLTLTEIERTLENQLKTEEKGLRTIGDLKLSYEDFKYLILKLKGLTRYISKVEVLEHYKLSIITALVFSLKYEEQGEKSIYQKVFDMLDKLQQHQIRYCISVCGTAFYELGISTYGIELRTIEDVFEVITLHAGISTEIYQDIFHMLDDYYTADETYLYDKKILKSITKKLNQVYPFIRMDRPHPLAYYIKELYEACKVQHDELEKLFFEFPNLSKNLIQTCYIWCMKSDHSVNRLINIR